MKFPNLRKNDKERREKKCVGRASSGRALVAEQQMTTDAEANRRSIARRTIFGYFRIRQTKYIGAHKLDSEEDDEKINSPSQEDDDIVRLQTSEVVL